MPSDLVQGQRTEAVLRHLPEAPAEARRVVRCLGAREVAGDARLFGLHALLSHYLPDELPLPPSALQALQFMAARNTRVTVEASELLAAHGIDSIALKGVPLALRLYPEPWLRPSADVDLLVSPPELERAVALFLGRGWRVAKEAPTSALELSQHAVLVGPGRRLLELHFTPASGFQSEFDVAGLFARSVTVRIGNANLKVLSPEDEIVQLSAHAVHHGFEGVKWLFDLKLALSRLTVDWDRVVRLAREARVGSATGMALRQARDRMGAEVPGNILTKLGPGRLRRLAMRGVLRLPRDVVGVYPHSLLLTDRLSVRWAKELLARPVGRLARLVGVSAALHRWVGDRSAFEEQPEHRGDTGEQP